MKAKHSFCILHSALCIGLAAFAASAQGTTYYVGPAGDDENDGLSTSTARATIPSAYADAADGDTIRLLPGVYRLSATLSVTKGVSIQGESRLNTTLRAASTGYRLISLNHADAEVANVTIRDVAAGSVAGFGVLIGANGGTLRDSRVTGCSGGSADNSGAVAFAANSPGAVRRTVIDGNTAKTSYGGGVHFQGGTAGAVIENCLITGNTASWGGGLYVNDGSLTIVNCTLVGNKASNNKKDCYYYRGTPSVRNTIIAELYTPSGTATRYSHCATSPTQSANNGNVAYAAGFRDAAALDYRLADGSPFAAAGEALGAGDPVTDIEGNAHDLATPSIGCHAAPGAVDLFADFAVSSDGCALGSVMTLTPDVTNASANASCAWFIGCDAGVGETRTTATNEPATFVAGEMGTYGARLVVADGQSSYAVARFNAIEIGAATNYVSATGSATYPYDTWAKAANDIPTALAAAVAGATVLVDDGTWPVASQLEVIKDIRFTSRNGRDATTLSASGGDRILYVNSPGATVSGFTFSGANRSTAHNLQYNAGSAACIDTQGGMIEDCLFENNGNSSVFHGTALAVASAAGTVRRSIFRNNATQNATYGCVYLNGGLIESCLLYGNTANFGGGIYIENGPARAINCTAVGNTATSGNGQDIYNYLQPSVLANCISGDIHNRGGNVATNNLLNLSAAVQDDLFFDMGTFNFTPKAGSAAVDAGRAVDGIGPRDVLGNARVQGEAIDIGACEYAVEALAVGFTCSAEEVFSGAEIAITPVFDAEGGATLSWTVTPPSGAVRTYATSGDEPLRITVGVAGAYDVAVTLSVGGRTATQSKTGAFRVGVPDAYVSKTGSATFPYDTAAKATPDPFAALAVAIDGTTVHVGAGIYDIVRALEVTDAVAIVGEGGREKTVLRHAADAAADSVLFVNNAGACVSGLTICGGRYAGGTRGSTGAGVCLFRDGGSLRDCIVTNNHRAAGSIHGSGVAVCGNRSVISHCVIADNGVQAGFSHYGHGGGLFVGEDGYVRIDNCLFLRNDATYGGGIYFDVRAGATFTNCTFSANVVTQKGAAIYNYSSHTVDAVNCAFADNVAKDFPATKIVGKFAFSHCAGDFEADGVFTPADFGFKDAPGGNYRLRNDSPLVNAGLTAGWLRGALDLDGRRRVNGGAVDIGCFETGAGATIFMAQ